MLNLKHLYKNSTAPVVAIAVGLAFVVFLYFYLFYPFHLIFKEQLQLFLLSSDYFHSYLAKPAWLVHYLSGFLTQFFHMRGVAPIILALLLFVQWLLIYQSQHHPKNRINAALLALWLPAFEFVSHLQLSNNLPLTLSIVIFLLVWRIFISTNKPNFRTLCIGLFLPLGWWLAGNLFLLLPILALVTSRKSSEKITFLLFLLLNIAIILYLRRYYLLPVAELFFAPAKSSTALIGTTVLLLIALLKYPSSELSRVKIARILFILFPVSVLLFGISKKANYVRENLLELDYYYQKQDFNHVLHLVKAKNLKSRTSTHFVNLSLSQKSSLPVNLLEYYQPGNNGLVLPVSPSESWLTIFFSSEFFYLIGDTEMTQHSAMLGQIFSPENRSIRMVQMLAKANLINGDLLAAAKYLQLAKQTLFYRNWANEMQIDIDNGADAEWISKKRAQLSGVDFIRKPNDYFGSLRKMAIDNPDNLAAVDILLCNYLLNKDLKTFFELYVKTAMRHPRPVPKVYSEALILILSANNASREEWIKYAIPDEIIRGFHGFLKSSQFNNTNFEAVRITYGNSYWFYYNYAQIVTK